MGNQAAPAMPAGLSPEEAALWRELAPRLADVPELAPVLRVYISYVCRWRAADAHIAEHGMLVAAPRTGNPIPNPHLRIVDRAAAMIAKLSRQLGLDKPIDVQGAAPIAEAVKPANLETFRRHRVVFAMPSPRLKRLVK